MKLGSILQSPIDTLEQNLKFAIQKREGVQLDILRLMSEAAGADDAIKGYRHALELLQEESNRV